MTRLDHHTRIRPRRRRAAIVLALAALAAALAGCGYTRILRNRLPAPHYTEHEGGRWVLFQYEAPQARHVNLCGNWEDNSWCGTEGTGRFDHTVDVMNDDDHDGIWEIYVQLKPGRYLYKYALDYGLRWEPDPSNPLGEDDGYGGTNSILILR